VSIDVFSADEQRAVAIDLARWGALARAALADEGVSGLAEVSLLFVTEDAIAELNAQFLGRSGPTDVLAFPIDDEPALTGRVPDSGGTGPGEGPEAEMPQLVGDIVLCPAVAARNALEHAVTVDDELALLVVHGVLHLLGWDHELPADGDKMEARERELLRRHYRAVTP
jgi:probable rRNA maturation factor